MNKSLFIKALYWVWVIYTFCGLLLILVAILLPPDTILQNTPTCYSIKQYGRQCFMCGSTRSFIQLGHGNFDAALGFNRLAVALFIVMIINLFIFIYYHITNNLLTNKKNSRL